MNKQLKLIWLGQSGFILRHNRCVTASDLYLSDFCRKKSKLDHTRLMPIPIDPRELNYIDNYLISHRHIDHFDPETIGPVKDACKKTIFYGPPDISSAVDEYFYEARQRFRFVRSFHKYHLDSDTTLVPIPAAHEELEKDTGGEYIAFSYILLLKSKKKAVLFCGDSVPYEKQAEYIRRFVPYDFKLVLLLPVNGRDKERAKMGFKGNMNVYEAISLFHKVNASLLVPCHFGMFALNDIKEHPDEEFFKANDCKAVVPELLKEIDLEEIL